MATAEHEPIRMALNGTGCVMHTYRTGRKGRIWYCYSTCLKCGAKARRLCNTTRGRVMVCNGKTQKAVEKADAVDIPRYQYTGITFDL